MNLIIFKFTIVSGNDLVSSGNKPDTQPGNVQIIIRTSPRHSYGLQLYMNTNLEAYRIW